MGSRRQAGVSPTIRAPTSSSLIGGEDAAGVAGEQAGLQAVARVVHVGQSLLEVVVGLNQDNGPEGLFIANLHARLGRGEDAGVITEPWRSPPAMSLAPPSTASLIQASTRSASAPRG
jgi:hypothetical protein